MEGSLSNHLVVMGSSSQLKERDVIFRDISRIFWSPLVESSVAASRCAKKRVMVSLYVLILHKRDGCGTFQYVLLPSLAEKIRARSPRRGGIRGISGS